MPSPAAMAMGASKNTLPKCIAEQDFLSLFAEKRGRSIWPMRCSIGEAGGFTWENLSRPRTALRTGRCAQLTCSLARLDIGLFAVLQIGSF